MFLNAAKSYAWLEFCLVSIIAFFNSAILNALLIEKDNSPRGSHVPAAIFILVSSIVSLPHLFLQNQLAVIFILTAVFFVQKLEDRTNVVNDSFFAGFFICLSSMFYPLVALLLILVLFRVVNTKWSVIRVFFLTIIGAIIPLYLIWTAYFLGNNGAGFVDAYFAAYQFTVSNLEFNIANKLSLGFFIVIGLLSVFSMMSSDSWKNVQPRGWLQFWLIIAIIFFTFGLVFKSQNAAFQIAIIPISGFLSFTILGSKRKILRSILFYLLLLVALLDQANSIALINLQ